MMPAPPHISLADLFGVTVAAISGVLAAGRKRLDLLGALVLAVVTAIGGGTIRDVLLNRHPIFWIAQPAYLMVIAAAAALTMVYTRVGHPPEKALRVADAFALAFFTIAGAQVAERTGVGAPIVVVMGTLTGVAGGMVRDVLSGEVPMVLRPGFLYATASLAGGTVYVMMTRLGAIHDSAAIAGMVTTFTIRLASIVWQLRLPALKVSHRL